MSTKDSRPEIVMFGRELFCPDVTRSRLRLTKLGIDWIERDINEDESAAQEVEKLTGMRRVPTIVVGSKTLVEPTNDALDAALVDAGYEINEDALLE